MKIERLSSWLQIAANVGILGGLVLVVFQLNQNSEILQAQMMSAESRSVIDQEMQLVGEQGAAAWVATMTDPTNVSMEHHRIMEAIFWSAVESWRHIEELSRLGLADVDPRARVTDEAPWYFGNTYGRAWWITRRETSGLSGELQQVINEVLSKSPNETVNLYNQLVEEVRRQDSEQ
jgi:hypothetical protein